MRFDLPLRQWSPNIPTSEQSTVKCYTTFKPRIDWDKGKALVWLLQALNIPREQAVIFFIGDDVTDEDAFRTLQDGGIGMIVEDTARYTYATYRLNNPDEVDKFLRYLIDFLLNVDMVGRARTKGK